jgi:CDP-3, 6-dideoxy-D-glycero-L-glycero-4-hexulose-4-reductase
VKTILVTGATGVLAKHFVSQYTSEFRIISGVRKPTQPNSIQVDSWTEIQSQVKIDAIVHFAGKYLVDDSPLSTQLVHDATVGTATALANFCKEHRTPLLALGSYFELAPLNMQPWSHYTIAKQAAAKIFEDASTKYGIPMRYVYAYDTYGQDLSRRKIIDVLLDPKTEMLELSPGDQKLNLTHENDFVEAVKLALEELFSEIGTFEKLQIRNNNDEWTLREIAETINSFRVKKIDLKFGSKPYRSKEVFEVWDCAPTIQEWSPKTNFQDFVSKHLGGFDGQ